MRARTAPLVLALLLLLPVVPAQAAPPVEETLSATGALDAAGRYIVLLKDGADARAVRQRHERQQGLKTDRGFGAAIPGFAGKLTKAQVSALEADPDVASVVPDEVVEVAAQTIPTGVSRIGARHSTMAKIDGIDTRVDADVAIVDTGIDKAHPDLYVAGGMNCTTSEKGAWTDGHGHGTHVAGTVGAIDNGSGVVGVAPGVRLWSVRILNSDGFGYLSWYLCGLDWIAGQRDPSDPSRPRFESVNMSVAKWGSDDGNCGYTNSDVLHQAICRVVKAGIPVAVAAGNDAGSSAARVPAAYNEVITVSALADTDGKAGGLGGNRCYSWGGYDRDDTFADFSNYGSDVDIIAPGKCIWSTLPGNRYGYSSGTSMATPAVAGAIALYKATRPWVSPGQVKQALQYLGSTNWAQQTDPDKTHERLLVVSRLGGAGDFSVAVADAGFVGETGGTVTVPVTLSRTTTHFERVALAVTTPEGITATLSVPSLMGFDATSASVSISVPASMAPGAYPVTVVATEGPRVRSATTTVLIEGDPPTAFPPNLVPAYKAALAGDTAAPVRVAWPAATDTTSHIAAYELEASVDNGPWQPAGAVTGSTTSTVRLVELGHTHRFRIRAADGAGNWSPWVSGLPLRLGIVQDTNPNLRWTSGWSKGTSSWASGGTMRYTSRAGASVTLTTTAKTLAFVAPVSSNRGSARIYVNGVLQATVSLYASTGASRRILWTKTYAAGTKQVRIEAVGTSGRPRIDVDAILTGW
jgi:subtilisin